MDQSHLDNKYFIDNYVYNCPFCKRNHVRYILKSSHVFDWTNSKKCYVFFVICQSCLKKSLHLSYENIPTEHNGGQFQFCDLEGCDLDQKFFYSVPTSFFTLDERIPKILRELFSEAEGCLQGNFLTGASACARKIIYELAIKEGASGENYEDRIKSLKEKKPDVVPEYFDTLLTIQQATSDKVHENSYDGWQSTHLRVFLSTIQEILNEIYVIPQIREERRNKILALRQDITESKKNQNGE